jgi:ribonuclease-3 family protein
VDLLRDYFCVDMPDSAIAGVSELGLAYIGDAVFELMVRSRLCAEGVVLSRKMHARAVQRVSAKAQAQAMERVLPKLTAYEAAAFKRGRNARVNTTRGTTREYHAATGLEALFGLLYLKGERRRLCELFDIIWKQ